MQYKTYTFRAYPNKTQEQLMYLTFTMCRTIYNSMLKAILKNYSSYIYEVEKCISNEKSFDSKKFSNSHKIPKVSTLKKQNENYKKVDSLALCAEYSNLVRGMELFYRGHSKLPKFKGRKDKNSYTTSQVNNNIRINKNKIRLPKLGFIKVRGMREIPCNFKIKRAIIFEDKKGKFYISIIFEYEESCNKRAIINSKVIGLDFKINNIFVSSDNFIPEFSTRFFYLLQDISKLQIKINKKNRFSKNYWKSINKLRNLHRRIVNIRSDTLNKLSSFLYKNYDLVIIEDISIQEIVFKLGSGKNTYNTGFMLFVKKLLYKFNEYLIKVNKWFPSSKKCSKCGKRKKKLKISQRIYRCKYCGLVIDRDLNAAINIKNEGIRILK